MAGTSPGCGGTNGLHAALGISLRKRANVELKITSLIVVSED
jgi:hypothetical protein